MKRTITTIEMILKKKNYSNNFNPNAIAISRSVERNKYKPSTPNYPSNNIYFTQNTKNLNNNMNNNINNANNLHQKKNSDFNYSSLINNFNSSNSKYILYITIN